MCGIAGVLQTDGRPIERGILEAMAAALSHRGPDGRGIWTNASVQAFGRSGISYGREGTVRSPERLNARTPERPNASIGLVHTRLAILDLSPLGRQPMSNEDGTVWITFNGEIYNFDDLRRELEGKGHHFRSRTDTEVIVHAYEEYGEECVRRLDGMFAFALWDERRRRLLVTRDRVGKKPLFFAPVLGGLAFASELQALLCHPGVARAVDRDAIDEYLTYGYVPAPRTAFRGIRKLSPAHMMSVDCGGPVEAPLRLEETRYWELQYTPKRALAEADACAELRELMTDAVRRRMVSDVPLGAFLSGGVDSSAVVGLMSELSPRPVQTFSIGFEESSHNELPFAREVAQRFGTDHHEFVVRPEALEVLPTLVRHYGEPYADSSAIPTFYLAQMTRQHVTVALNGDGGDESFAGYERYLANVVAERYQRLPGWVRGGVVEPMARLMPDSLDGRSRVRQARRFLAVAAQPMERRYVRWISTMSSEVKQSVYDPAFAGSLNGTRDGAWLQTLIGSARALGPLDGAMKVDVESYLPFDLLVKVDITSMANSLEARSPFLDHRVMEFAAGLTPALKVRGTRLKMLLKRAFADMLPRATTERRKMGFGVPVGAWFRGEMRGFLQETVLSPRALQRGYFQAPAVRRLVEQHARGEADHTYPLWSLLMLELWHRELVDGQGAVRA
jgi:asparagine synthase (glutamine-hydrolysing)